MSKTPVALQLYSFRHEAATDFSAVLEKTSKLGYQGVEFAGYGGMGSAELKAKLDELGLEAVSSHVPYQQLVENLDEVIVFNLALGNNTVVCPVTPQGFEQSVDNWKQFGATLTEIGKKCSDKGVRFGYHNHSFEFTKFGNEYGLDILLGSVDPAYVFAQLDLGWVLHGKANPVEYLHKYSGRCPLVHIKDFKSGKQTEVGLGDLPLQEIVNTARTVGVEWLILETEEYSVSAEESVRLGLNNIRQAQT